MPPPSSLPSNDFTVRLSSLDSDEETLFSSTSRSSRRIVLNAEVLRAHKIFAGDVLALTASNSLSSQFAVAFTVGIAWPSVEVAADVVTVSQTHFLSAHLSDNCKVRIIPLSEGKNVLGLPSSRTISEARTIIVEEDGDVVGDVQRRDWLTLYLRELLVDHKYVFIGQKLLTKFEGKDKQFSVVHASTKDHTQPHTDLPVEFASMNLEQASVWTASWDTQVILRDHKKQEKKTEPVAESALSGLDDNEGYSFVGGLDKQISQIRDLIEIPLLRPDLFRYFGLQPPRGVLLYGPPGTGKTHLARAVVAATRANFLSIAGAELASAYHGETEARLRQVFTDARQKSPCIVVLDEVDALCPRREDGAGGEVEKRVVATLLTIMDGMNSGKVNPSDGEEEPRVVVIATTNRPNAIDPALRRPGRFDREIEIGIPDASARLSILKVILSRTPNGIAEDQLRAVAARTHGYVGADLAAVVREAGTEAIKRFMSSCNTNQAVSPRSSTATPPPLSLEDLELGLTHVQPSALREVFLETPSVRWGDIGGQARVRDALRECVEQPLLHPEAFARLGVHAPRGVLLYGPPGCSKTLVARALASESGVNFIAVKGPELLNKYVGESERAVRETFRKARAAAPSIIFFDEIDALGTSRSGDDSSGGRHEGVLTTLLNEMDGVQELVGVTVVAATNRPDVIDSALMRPGRLDRILYVGPPDRSGRVEILQIRTRSMAVGPDVDLEDLADLTEGCSGAELAAMCQDAALLTMRYDINAPFVTQAAFLQAAVNVRRQITPDVIARFDEWRKRSGVSSV